MRLSKIAAVIAIMFGCLNSVANAQIGASVTYTSLQLSANSYQYTFTLHNTGTTNIGTFWLGWTAASFENIGYAYDLLPTQPTGTTSPAGWTGPAVQDGLGGGWAVEWYDTSGPLASGNTLSGFTITTADTPAQMAGPSIFGSSFPVSTSWVYVGALQDGANQSDQGAVFNATAVPEPVIGLLAPLILLGIRRRRQAV